MHTYMGEIFVFEIGDKRRHSIDKKKLQRYNVFDNIQISL